jgi:hypothetical protein
MKQIIGMFLLSIILLVSTTPALAVIDKKVDLIVLSVGLDLDKEIYKGNYVFPAPQEQIILNSLYKVGISYKGDYIYPVPLNNSNGYLFYTSNILTFKDLPMVVPLLG